MAKLRKKGVSRKGNVLKLERPFGFYTEIPYMWDHLKNHNLLAFRIFIDQTRKCSIKKLKDEQLSPNMVGDM